MSDNEKKRQLPPDHLAAQDISSLSYKDYVNRLKQGAKSGISDLLGSAADLFGDSSALPVAPKLEIASLRPESERVLASSFQKLARCTAYDCREFLNRYVNDCENGMYGASIRQASTSPCVRANFDRALKFLVCTSIHLSAVEQIDPATGPDWLKELVFLCLCFADKLTDEPPLNAIMRYFTSDRQQVCKAGANGVIRELALGQTGDDGWNAVLTYLRESGQKRFEFMKAVLSSN